VLNNDILSSYYYFNDFRRVPGVRRASVSEPVRAGGAPRKNFSIEGILADCKPFVSEERFAELEAHIRSIYK